MVSLIWTHVSTNRGNDTGYELVIVINLALGFSYTTTPPQESHLRALIKLDMTEALIRDI